MRTSVRFSGPITVNRTTCSQPAAAVIRPRQLSGRSDLEPPVVRR